jgi:predicted transcriptional regulator
MKAILMSIRPQHLVNILNGKKTIELRKKFPSDYRGWVYSYCTLGKPYLYECALYSLSKEGERFLSGKVVCRFWVENVEEIICRRFWGQWESYTKTLGYSEISQASCLGNREIVHYLKGNNGSAIHISKLEIFDRPRELCEFHTNIKKEPPEELLCHKCGKPMEYYEYKYLTKAPQSWQYIYIEEDK